MYGIVKQENMFKESYEFETSELPVGTNMSMNGCLSPRVVPVMDWRPVLVVPPPLHPMAAGIGSSPTATLEG